MEDNIETSDYHISIQSEIQLRTGNQWIRLDIQKTVQRISRESDTESPHVKLRCYSVTFKGILVVLWNCHGGQAAAHFRPGHCASSRGIKMRLSHLIAIDELLEAQM